MIMLEEIAKPPDYEMSKWLLGIISLLIGLCVSQLIEVFKKSWKQRETRSALRIELEVLADQLKHLKQYYSDEVQNYVVGYSRGQFPVFPNCPVFEKLYPEVLIKLTKSERLSYDAIHTFLDRLRENYDREVALSRQANLSGDLDLHDERGTIVQSQYLNCGMLEWRIRYVLSHPDDPHIEDSVAGMKKFASHRDSLKDDMSRLIKDAERLPAKKFVEGKKYSSAEFYRRPRKH